MAKGDEIKPDFDWLYFVLSRVGVRGQHFFDADPDMQEPGFAEMEYGVAAVHYGYSVVPSCFRLLSGSSIPARFAERMVLAEEFFANRLLSRIRNS